MLCYCAAVLAYSGCSLVNRILAAMYNHLPQEQMFVSTQQLQSQSLLLAGLLYMSANAAERPRYDAQNRPVGRHRTWVSHT